ncbi:MAG: hypothetical protein R6V75_03935 [Bacteroidales bacterium]
MGRIRAFPGVKVVLFPISVLLLLSGCQQDNDQQSAEEPLRFEKILFESAPSQVIDTFQGQLAAIKPFFEIFNEEIIQIGPDSLAGYPAALESFTKDPILLSVYLDINKNWPALSEQIKLLKRSLNKMEQQLGIESPTLVTYLSGFNESFITLPGMLGLGLDKYLGSVYPYYQELGIPEYIRIRMNPDHLATDGLKAWLMSEMEPPEPGATFLDHLIYQGKIHYLLNHYLRGVPGHLHFHFSQQQLKWCREHEREMWKFLAENRILFSTDRMTIRKYHEDAPFTKDFGNESPGKTGCWIGFRIVQGYLKATRQDPGVLLTNVSSQTILAESRYRP